MQIEPYKCVVQFEDIYNTFSSFHSSIFVYNIRSSHQQAFHKETCSQKFAEFTGKHLSQTLFFDKVAGWGLHLYLKKDSDPCVFLWIFRTLCRTTPGDYFRNMHFFYKNQIILGEPQCSYCFSKIDWFVFILFL